MIDITCDMIRNHGMEQVSIRNITKEAGYNSATLYSYFKNLSDLLLSVHIRFEEELLLRYKKEVARLEGITYYAM